MLQNQKKKSKVVIFSCYSVTAAMNSCMYNWSRLNKGVIVLGNVHSWSGAVNLEQIIVVQMCTGLGECLKKKKKM